MPAGTTLVRVRWTPRPNLADLANDEEEDDDVSPQGNPLQSSGGGGGAPSDGGGAGAPGSAAGGGGGDNNDNDEEMPPAKSKDEDPFEGHDGRDYIPHSAKGKQMAKMLINFCGLSKSNVNAIVLYFGVSAMHKLAEFYEEH